MYINMYVYIQRYKQTDGGTDRQAHIRLKEELNPSESGQELASEQHGRHALPGPSVPQLH